MKFPDDILGLISRYESNPNILVERIKAGILPKEYTQLYNVKYELYMSINGGNYNIKALDLSGCNLTKLPNDLPIGLI